MKRTKKEKMGNIFLFQLAADASNVVAMTEEEKKRLEEILSDLGDLMEEVGCVVHAM